MKRASLFLITFLVACSGPTLPVAPPRVATASYYAPITLEVAHQLCNLAGGVTWVD